jgi:hypothetical protein
MGATWWVRDAVVGLVGNGGTGAVPAQKRC